MDIHVTDSLMGGRKKKPCIATVKEKYAHVITITETPGKGGTYVVSHGHRLRTWGNAVTESGFFYRAGHLDTRGLWATSSLNLPEAQKQIEAYEAPKPAHEIVFNGKCNDSKFEQHGTKAEWHGVVLAAQNPHDRSISTVSPSGTEEEYWQFFAGACGHYGKHLFVKFHPQDSGATVQKARGIMRDWGCSGDYVDHSVIEHCKFVLLFSSTYSIDAMLRGKRVAQYAPGYFYRTGAVTYTDWTYPDDVEDTEWKERKLLDFLVWRYCFCHLMPHEDLVAAVNAFAVATEDVLFPLPEELSYGAKYDWIWRYNGNDSSVRKQLEHRL
jgi:hypothetical protein